MLLEGKRIALLVGPGFEDLEFYVTLMRLREEGAKTVIVGINLGEIYPGKGGLHAKADVDCNSVNSSMG